VVEVSESFEAELPDTGGRELPAGVASLALDPVDNLVQAPRVDVALVGGADERAAELRPVERLAVAVALDHLERLGDRSLVRGEAVTAGRALATTTDRPIGNAPGLESLSSGVATWTAHSPKCTEA